MNEYIASSSSLASYFAFVGKDNRILSILAEGLKIFLPITLVVYAVGGLWEGLFACVRRHEISEGFLVTGILLVLVLPPTIPLWMAALGTSIGIVFAKEIFGGVGMNIVNPALACRAFLFFGFPGKMSGNVWVGANPAVIRESLITMNKNGNTTPLDGYTQATKLAQFNIAPEIKKIHVDAIATNNVGDSVGSFDTIQRQFQAWNEGHGATLGSLTQEQMREFVTTPTGSGGLGLSPGYYEDAFQFSGLNFGIGENNDWNFFLGNQLGSLEKPRLWRAYWELSF